MPSLRVMVIGAGGYIGSRLTRRLISQEIEVHAVDRFFFGTGVFRDFEDNKNFFRYKLDARDLDETLFKSIDVVIDLAALSNDPSSALNTSITMEINRDARIMNANLAKKAGVRKYILSSSCAVYGSTSGKMVDENSETNPLTAYAKSSLEAEKGILEFCNENSEFSATIIRNGTVFGYSERMRFDLVLNLMVLDAFKRKSISILGGGKQWRPLVHIEDVADTIVKITTSNLQIYRNQIINLALDNFQIRNLAYIIKDALNKDIDIIEVYEDSDARDYIVSIDKSRFLQVEAKRSLESGISEIYEKLIKGSIRTDERTVTLSWYKRLQEAESLYHELNIDGKILGPRGSA